MQRRRALAASRHALKTLKKVSHSGRKEIQKTDRRCELALSVPDSNKKRVKDSGNFTSLQDALQAFFRANSQR